MAKFCQDIVLNIVFRLPVKSILRFRCVSKAWCKLLKDPNFLKKHLNLATAMNKFSVMMVSGSYYDEFMDTYTLAYDPSLSTLSNRVGVKYPSRDAFCGITVWGICNGLICISPFTMAEHVVLWNPATKEFKEVPSVPIEPGIKYSYCEHAFGYDDTNDDFVGSERYEAFCEVQVYTLKSNSWRRLENISWFLCAGDCMMDQVNVNGAIHWLTSTDSQPDNIIASFDFKDDRFNEMPVPRFCNEYADTKLCSLGGSLCLHGFIGSRIDIWEMKEYRVTESWAKLITFNLDTIPQFSRCLIPLQYVKNGEVLLGYETDAGYHLDLYDITRGTFINLKAYTKRPSCYGKCTSTFIYVESLVRLNSGTYVGLPEIEESTGSS